MDYCRGIVNGEYCPLNDICFRCCECEKSRNLARYGKMKESFAKYDKKERTCPYYLNRSQWIAIKMLKKL